MVAVLRILFISFILFQFSNSEIYGNGHFSKQGESEYINQLSEIFSVSADRRAARAFVSEVEEFWVSPETPDHLKELMMLVSDKIHEKRGRPYPDFHSYLTTIMLFVESHHPERSFETWHKGLLELLQNPRYPLRHAIRLFDHTTNMLNNQVVFSTAALDWKAHNPTYHFHFSDSMYIVITRPTTIVCQAREDSIMVYNTTGRVNLMSGIWQGESGRITWEQSGFASNMVYGTFGNYQIDMSRNQFEVEDVEFYNRHYFNHSLKGRVHHRLMNIRNPENTTFPRFESYEQRYQIDNIHNNFNYEGGFSQHGSKFLGSGTAHNPAIITIFRNDKPFIVAKSRYFALRQDQIISNTTEVTIQLDTGYIYHPGLLFKYMDPVKEIHLIRDGNGISRSPFFNTYHNISMDTELIKWQMNRDFMELRMVTGAAENHAFFESISYFREEFFHQLQGMDAIHPLQGLLNCFRHNKEQPFTAGDYARFMRIPENQIRQQIIGLSFHGFIGYNVDTDTIEIRDRLKDYLQFRAGFKDYDVIRFRSTTPGSTPNARFDLLNYDLEMNGVSVVTISDRQNVVFFPENERLVMKKDRNFSFDGSLTAGMIDLFGDGFTFNYQNFRIDLNTIDSMAMRIETDGQDYIGRRAQRRINSTIAQLSGFLEIDRPDNKSGKEIYPEYPRLTSNTNSFVYYDRPFIQNGAYDRERFYFELNPFEISSINRLTRRNVEFTGVFSSTVFPDIEEKLVVRPDYSLGFRRSTPQEGYPIYDNRASYTNIIDLSNQGLLGNGTVSYITTTASSEQFTFLPEQTHGLAHRFNIEPRDNGVEFPDVQARFVNINYLPFEEKMLAEIQDEPFTLFSQETNLEGTLNITPNGLSGDGILHMPNANLVAKHMDFTHHVVVADSSDFNLVSDDEEFDVSFKTSNLLSTINFKERQGTFSSRDIGSKVEFTENRFIAYISEFSWEIDRNEILLGARGSAGNRFVSTHRRQDSLDLIVPIAQYDIQSRRIFAQEVRSINVADTEMILHDGNVTINRNAVIDPLESVNIVLNDSIHRFYDATVTVEGKYSYNAAGKYDFINGNKETKTINFSQIGVNRNRTTTAEAEIQERELFTFNRHFAFKGKTTLTAGNPLLRFDGGAQMLHDCSTQGPQNYVRFDSTINPDSVYIPIPESVRNYEFENIYNNFFLNRDSNIVYAAFLEERKFHSDAPILSANGYLYFDPAYNSFSIAQSQLIQNPDTTGNIMRFHNDGCLVTGRGNINMGLDLGRVRTFASGDISHTRSDSLATLNTLFGLDFMLDKESIELMASEFNNTTGNDANPSSSISVNRLAEWMGAETAVKVGEEISKKEELESLPEEHQHLLVMDSLQWRWDPPSRSYIADSEVLLKYIKNQPVNKKVHVKAVIAFSRGGNSLDMHIQACDTTYFFFSYRNNQMQTRSSMAAYNTNVQTLDADERRIRGRLGDAGYSFILAPESRMRRHLRLFEEEETDELIYDDSDELIDEDSEYDAPDE
ncbi:hypothetical protein [Alkalitalea saponilacus]|uniref:Uncharacterized protein n=1 Tax=Alkalitalea saponilacus TaxID=889453 RepID=A0A1T5H8K5_9BACT|nr:hypothetical protein [Alkalitalea saponilacus]ASB50835.1 hypothetical protein CDL62_17590 [Alkalitalea saponilacus]SKC17012.1 hypothetical protein SAMN03080601_02142 [Alkalitalea saponilacus]